MSAVEDHAGRVLMVGLSGPTLTGPERDALVALRPGGIILFRRNLQDPAALPELLREVQAVLPPPPLVAIDQEGGRVSRLEGWIGPTPTATALSTAGEQAALRFARATALGLRTLGFNLDFAPVVDLCDATADNGIGNRSFGNDPVVVGRIAGSFLDGLQQAGVAGCLKHFPGLGETDVDSHDQLPTVLRTRDRLESEDLLPYRSLGGRAAAVMVGHGHYPALDPQPGLPATLSSTIVTGWLRDRIGFRGMAVSDDLEMGAVASLDTGGVAAVAAVAAGCDLILYCSDASRAERARNALVEAARADPAFATRLEDAARTVTRTAERWPVPRPDLTAWRLAQHELLEASRIG